jgi:hypothetical protein
LAADSDSDSDSDGDDDDDDDDDDDATTAHGARGFVSCNPRERGDDGGATYFPRVGRRHRR